jgi:hypothetical protein
MFDRREVIHSNGSRDRANNDIHIK